MSTVPEDLLRELLSLLPSTDLLRFRCVSKSWRALIDSSCFVQLHLNNSLKDIKSRKMLVLKPYLDDSYDRKYLFRTISLDSEFRFAIPTIDGPLEEDFTRLEYVGSCRSLICLRFWFVNYIFKIVVWNPCTRSHRVLPFAPVEIEGATWKYPDFRYAFGYDEAADDYKVVRLTFDHVIDDYEVRVYSLKLDTWKKIEKVPLPFSSSTMIMSKPILTNGAAIWVVEGGDPTAIFLLAVTLIRTEVLQLVSLGDCYKFDFKYKHCSSCRYLKSEWDLSGCDCEFRDLVKLIINNEKIHTLTNLLLPDPGIDYLEDSFHEKVRSELPDCRGSKCCWVDSLVRVERSNNKLEMSRAPPPSEPQGEDYKHCSKKRGKASKLSRPKRKKVRSASIPSH